MASQARNADCAASGVTMATDNVPGNCTQLFADLQSTLAKRYDIFQPYSVEPFISHDAETLARITGVKPTTPEMMLVQEDGNNLDITVFLDKQLISALSNLNWDQHWNGKYFNHYCIVLEGISHFVYLSWNAYYDRPVKWLELELQAEIDKFVFASIDANAQDTRELISRLFEDVRYHESLSEESRDRYETANELAQGYCCWLNDNFDIRDHNRRLTAELARFYRTRGNDKCRHIIERTH